MTDYLFEEVLNRRGKVTRPAVAVGADGVAREATYGGVGTVALRLRAARATLDGGLLGQWPTATVVGYMEPGVVQALDRVGLILAATALAAAADASLEGIEVEDASAISAGSRLQLSAGAAFFETVATAVAGTAVTLQDPLPVAFPAGASVDVVSSYEVLGVEDDGGAGHHVRVGMRLRNGC